MKTESENKKLLKESLFARIESEQVCPKSKLFFRCKECFVWMFWVVSVVIGAFSVAISLFVAMHHQYYFYEATHNNFFTFLVDALPYLWIITFGLMVYFAVYNLRNTARGYRYSVWMIIVSSVVVSFAAGSALQMFGIGYSIDSILGSHMSQYMSQEKQDQKVWQSPREGRLLGKQVLSTISPTTTVVFEDYTGQRWRMNIDELHPQDIDLLATGKTVKLLGQAMDENMFIFHACGAFHWMMGKDVTLDELSEERRMFIDRVAMHAYKQRKPTLEKGEVLASTSLPKESVCANMRSVKKMPIKDAY